MMNHPCESCMYYTYDEEWECYVCDLNIDEDDAARLVAGRRQSCPYYHYYIEYDVVKKQM